MQIPYGKQNINDADVDASAHAGTPLQRSKATITAEYLLKAFIDGELGGTHTRCRSERINLPSVDQNENPRAINGEH